MCGWKSDELPWILENYPGAKADAMPPSPPSIPALDLIPPEDPSAPPPEDLVQAGRRLNTNSTSYGCDGTRYPLTLFQIAFVPDNVEDVSAGIRAAILETFFALILQMVAMIFILRNLYRKLPGWMAAGGEEGAEGAEKINATKEAVPAKPRSQVAHVPV